MVELKLPETWARIQGPSGHIGAWFRRADGLQVCVTEERHPDGVEWMHVSVARRSRLPSWEDVKVVRNLFLNPDAEAFQMLPPQAEYVNTHPYALHMWSRLDGSRVMPHSRMFV